MASKVESPSQTVYPYAGSTHRRSFIPKYWPLYVLSIPGIAFFLLFKYIPLLGSVIAFQNYSIFSKISGSPWVGLEHFQRMFQYAEFLNILKNTIILGVYTMVIVFPIPIVLALLINELRLVLFKRTVQWVVYMPHFLSWVIVGGIVVGLLSPTTGFVNHVLASFGVKPIYFLGENQFIRSIIIGSSVWKETGWGTIIYLAAIAGINPELYEAAVLDGAGRLKQTLRITLPALLPTITVLFLLQIGQFLDYGFEKVYVFLNSLNSENGEIIDTYVFRAGLVNHQYSYTTAIGLFKSVVGLIMIVFGNYFSKKATGEGLY